MVYVMRPTPQVFPGRAQVWKKDTSPFFLDALHVTQNAGEFLANRSIHDKVCNVEPQRLPVKTMIPGPDRGRVARRLPGSLCVSRLVVVAEPERVANKLQIKDALLAIEDLTMKYGIRERLWRRVSEVAHCQFALTGYVKYERICSYGYDDFWLSVLLYNV